MTKKFFRVFIINMKTDNVTFRANPINKVVIQKLNKKSNTFAGYPAMFVQLDPNNYLDIQAVDKASNKWKNAKYIQRIATASHWMKAANIEIYAVTTQTEKFNKLIPNRILGFAEMRKDGNFPKYKWLYYLQVKPEAINVNNDGKKNYKHVGTSIIKSLKKIYKNISLYSEDDLNVQKFYQKNGFIQDMIGIKHYKWSSNIFRQLKNRYDRFMLRHGIGI